MSQQLETIEQPVQTQPARKNKKVSSWADAVVRCAEIAALTGNFLPFLWAFVLCFFAWKLTSADLKELLLTLITSAWFSLLGWALFFGSVFVAIRLFQWKDRVHQNEIDRASGVKNIAIQKHFELELPSSKKKD